MEFGGLDSAAIVSVATLAKEATSASEKVCALKIQGVRSKSVVLLNGAVHEYPVEPADRQHKLKCVSDIPAFVRYVNSELEARPVIWVSEQRVQIVLDDSIDSQRWDRAVLEFSPTSIFTLLTEMYSKRLEQSWKDQAALARLIRLELWDYLSDGHSLLRKVRSLKATQESSIGRGSGTFSTELVATEGASVSELPDEILLTIGAIDEPSIPEINPVRCVLEIDPNGRLFRLVPMEPDLVDARRKDMTFLLNSIRNSLKDTEDADTPVFCGNPE